MDRTHDETAAQYAARKSAEQEAEKAEAAARHPRTTSPQLVDETAVAPARKDFGAGTRVAFDGGRQGVVVAAAGVGFKIKADNGEIFVRKGEDLVDLKAAAIDDSVAAKRREKERHDQEIADEEARKVRVAEAKVEERRLAEVEKAHAARVSSGRALPQ